MKLADRVAIVTGAAGGIGEAYARALAAEGASVVIADVDETKIQAESRDGVLTVRLPKTEARKPRPIEVQVR